jgi:hypothetical protein
MATLEMAKATQMKPEVAYDNTAFKLFSRPLESVYDASARAYFMMRRDLEMVILKGRIEDEMNPSAPTPAAAQVVPPTLIPSVPRQFVSFGMARHAVSPTASASSVPPPAASTNEFRSPESAAGVGDFRCPVEEPRQYAMNSFDLASTLQLGSHDVGFDMNN